MSKKRKRGVPPFEVRLADLLADELRRRHGRRLANVGLRAPETQLAIRGAAEVAAEAAAPRLAEALEEFVSMMEEGPA